MFESVLALCAAALIERSLLHRSQLLSLESYFILLSLMGGQIICWFQSILIESGVSAECRVPPMGVLVDSSPHFVHMLLWGD